MDDHPPGRPLRRLASPPHPSASSSSSSHFTPFPFGSPLTHVDRSVLSPWSAQVDSNGVRRASAGSSSNNSSSGPAEESAAAAAASAAMITRPRMRGRDFYGGRVSFGGAPSPSSLSLSATGGAGAGAGAAASFLRRSNRLLASSPYFSQDRLAQRQQRRQRARDNSAQDQTGAGINTTNEEQHKSHGESRFGAPVDRGDVSGSCAISTTAKTILDTLERMNTPVRDAQKIPVPRAERRRQIAEDLLESTSGSLLSGPYRSRRRPRLSLPAASAAAGTNSSGFLSGPPLRSNLFAPLAGSPRRSQQRQQPEPRLTRLEPRPTVSSSTAKTRSSLEASKPAATPFPAGFFANAFSSSSTATATAAASAPPPNVSVKEVPSSGRMETGGKVRAKVTEKARVRAEKALDGGGGVDEGAPAIPDYLSRAGASASVFAGMTSLPQFQFSSPKKVGESATAGEKSSSSPLGNLTPERGTTRKLEADQAVLTSPDLNPADSPLPASATGPGGGRRRLRDVSAVVVPPFPDPVSVMQGLFATSKKSAPASSTSVATSVSATPLTNGMNGGDEEEGEEVGDGGYGKAGSSFKFSAPNQLKKKTSGNSWAHKGNACCYSFDFSSPVNVASRDES